MNPGVPTTYCEATPPGDRNCNGIEDTEECLTPVLVDVAHNGFSLTSKSDGVRFDMNGDGILRQLPWTLAGGDDSWLALDRNENGRIENGTELFGAATPQPPSAQRNGFIALAEFDTPDNGGNADGSSTRLTSCTRSLFFGGTPITMASRSQRN